MSRRGDVSNQPWYLFSPRLVSGVLWSVLRQRRRSFAQDADLLLSPLQPPPAVEGAQLIPAAGAFLVVTNHYTRPGLDAWWGPALITQVIAQRRPDTPVHWLMTNAWLYHDRLHSWTVTPVTRWLFTHLAQMYDFVTTPPVYDGGVQPREGAIAVRRFLTLAQQARARGEVLAIAPEGGGDAAHPGCLVAPPPGTGRFLLLLAHQTETASPDASLPFLPVGMAECDGRLTATFGQRFSLLLPAALPKAQADAWASHQVMLAIGRLLPAELWGKYASDLGVRRTGC
jgi:hypothetical protein